MGLLYRYGVGLPNGCLVADDDDLAVTAEALLLAERSGDDFALNSAKFARGLVLAHHRGPQRVEALDLLAIAADAARREIFTMWILPIIDFEIAKEKAHTGDLDGAIELARRLVDAEFASGQLISRAAAVTLLVDFLLERATAADPGEAQTAWIDWRPTRPNRESSSTRSQCSVGVPNLRRRTATRAFQRIVSEYRDKATAYGFEGHLAMADAMTSG